MIEGAAFLFCLFLLIMYSENGLFISEPPIKQKEVLLVANQYEDEELHYNFTKHDIPMSSSLDNGTAQPIHKIIE